MPMLHAIMEMPETLQDKILVLCGIISENTKKNHAKNSLPPETRSNASTDARIWESGPATLNPLNWHFYRFALGHHHFQHKLSPYDEQEAILVSSRHNSVQAQASTATSLRIDPGTVTIPQYRFNKTKQHTHTHKKHPSPLHATLHPT